MDSIEKVAEAFHDAYERLAPDFHYRTRDESAKAWADVPERNKALMVATVGALLEGGVIVPVAEFERLRELVRSLDELVCRFCTATGEPIPEDAIKQARRLRSGSHPGAVAEGSR